MNNRKKSITKKMSVLFLLMFALTIISSFALKPQNAFAYNCRGNHTWGSWQITKAATCYSTGTKKRKCTKCGATRTVTTNKTNHNWVGWYTSKYPTCTSTGTKYQYCKMCSQRQYATIPALGHAAGSSWTTQKEATCSSNGLAVCICSRSNCNYIVSQKSIPKTNAHNFVNGRCTGCGYTVDTTSIPMKYYSGSTTGSNFKGRIDPTLYNTDQSIKLQETSGCSDQQIADLLKLSGEEKNANLKADGMKLVFKSNGTIVASLKYPSNKITDATTGFSIVDKGLYEEINGHPAPNEWHEYAYVNYSNDKIVLYPISRQYTDEVCNPAYSRNPIIDPLHSTTLKAD